MSHGGGGGVKIKSSGDDVAIPGAFGRDPKPGTAPPRRDPGFGADTSINAAMTTTQSPARPTEQAASTTDKTQSGRSALNDTMHATHLQA